MNLVGDEMSISFLTKEQKEHYNSNGYVIIKNCYSESKIKDLVQIYKEIWIEKIANGELVQNLEQPIQSLFPRLKDYHKENPEILDFVLSPKVMDIVEELMGEEACLVSTNYYFKGPGTLGVPFHQDNYGIGVTPGTCLAVWVSLDQASPVNGGMRVAPGSHKMPLLTPKKIRDSQADTFAGYVQVLELPQEYELVELVTDPGDIVIYHGHLIHDSLNNTTEDEFRRSIISHYAGIQAEKVTLNYNYLFNRSKERIRKRMNLTSLKQ